jgi:Mg-chelatase subunit ChlD
MSIRLRFLPALALATALFGLWTDSAWNVPPQVAAQASVGVCNLSGAQRADASVLTGGRSVGIVLDVTADCLSGAGARADIFLLLDRSNSMGQEGKLEAAHSAVRMFVGAVDFTRHRVGLVPFANDAYIGQTLTHDPERVIAALHNSGGAEQSTNIAKAIQVADREFAETTRPGAVRVMILLTDGQSNPDSMAAAAKEALDNGTVIFAIALGPDADRAALSRVASSNEHISFAATAEDLNAVYDRIASIIQSYSVTEVALSVQPAAGAAYVLGSGQPDQPAGATPMVWQRTVVTDGIDLSYRLVLTQPGRYRPVTAAWVDYTDGDGSRRRYNLPLMDEIEVRPPVVSHAFLPLTFARGCIPAASGADVVLALDNSDSMRGSKLADAVAAAGAFLQLLEPDRDQAAIVTYSADAQLAHRLTSDRSALLRTLAAIPPSNGTRLDRGLAVAVEEALGERHRPRNRPVVVLLSDGNQHEERGEAVSVASIARAAGVTVFVIGLGSDVDMGLLRAVAGHPSRAYFAPDAQALAGIYLQVGGAVTCR